MGNVCVAWNVIHAEGLLQKLGDLGIRCAQGIDPDVAGEIAGGFVVILIVVVIVIIVINIIIIVMQ